MPRALWSSAPANHCTRRADRQATLLGISIVAPGGHSRANRGLPDHHHDFLGRTSFEAVPIPTLGALFTRGWPVQDPVLTIVS